MSRPEGRPNLHSGATSLAAGLGAIWVSHDDGTVTKVDPITVRASPFSHVDGSARTITVDEARDTVWVDIRSPRA